LKIELPSGTFSLDRPRVMGILNTTPDSFYDHGRYATLEKAVQRAERMADEGADLIDVGGEKAGPGNPVSIEEEIARVVPVIEAVRRRVDAPISVDTFKPEVARRAVDAGADIINSISGFRDTAMRTVAAQTSAAIVIMHIKGEPRVANPSPHYDDVVTEVQGFLQDRVRDCIADGIPEDRIIIDPGPGFGKTTSQDLQIVRGLQYLTSMNYPVLLAVSRKKFIGDVLDVPVDERLEGSLALVAWGVLHGAKILRVHDVRATRRVVDMTTAVLDPQAVETRV
jgi:dihydropteroate synthase